jgi:hypothetical protein
MLGIDPTFCTGHPHEGIQIDEANRALEGSSGSYDIPASCLSSSLDKFACVQPFLHLDHQRGKSALPLLFGPPDNALGLGKCNRLRHEGAVLVIAAEG